MESINGAENSSYLDMTSPPPQSKTFSFPDQPAVEDKPRVASVRYTKEPRLSGDGATENAALVPENQPPESRERVSRSYSSASRLSGPGWRSNMRGDYRGQDMSPVCTKDLLCWAYQITRGMEYLASKKVGPGESLLGVHYMRPNARFCTET